MLNKRKAMLEEILIKNEGKTLEFKVALIAKDHSNSRCLCKHCRWDNSAWD
jgi:hypothetical protein